MWGVSPSAFACPSPPGEDKRTGENERNAPPAPPALVPSQEERQELEDIAAGACLTPLTPNTVELIPTIGALSPRGGPVPNLVLTLPVPASLPALSRTPEPAFAAALLRGLLRIPARGSTAAPEKGHAAIAREECSGQLTSRLITLLGSTATTRTVEQRGCVCERERECVRKSV